MSTLTLDIFKEFMNELSVNAANNPRQMIVQTGVQGMNMFYTVMKEEAERESLRLRRKDANKRAGRVRFNKKDITHTEWQNLKKMINSPDLENLVLAETILEQYEQR